MQEEYNFIRNYLNYKIKMVYSDEIPECLPKISTAYIDYSNKNPTCSIVKRKSINATSARSLYHEACHVYEYRTFGFTNEELSTEYGNNIYTKFAQLIYVR